nr:MAG TPA: hypothetical protein [Caudoviricetes sp.]
MIYTCCIRVKHNRIDYSNGQARQTGERYINPAERSRAREVFALRRRDRKTFDPLTVQKNLLYYHARIMKLVAYATFVPPTSYSYYYAKLF